MSLFKDISNFFSFLSFVDIVFLIAVVVLLILIVALIYFVKINKEIFTEEDFFPSSKKESVITDNENNVLEIAKIDTNHADDTMEFNDEEGELLDLETLTEKLKNEKEEDRISFTEYEKDQEEKAIISYDELLDKKNKYAINYEKEEMIDDLLVKKIDLNNFENNKSDEEIYEEVRVISYQKEEDFLKALKELNNLLN